MKKSIFLLLPLLVAAWGCQSFEDTLTPSDMTVSQLEEKMSKAMDPESRYSSSTNCIIKQLVKIPQFLDEDQESMVVTKLKKPGKFHISTIKDNEPVNVVCSDGINGWVADYDSKSITVLDGTQLTRMLTLAKIGNQPGGYSKIFKKVEIFRCTMDDRQYYVLHCTGNTDTVFDIFVDAKTFFVSMVKAKVKIGIANTLDYESKVLSYRRYDGVVIPQESIDIQNGQTRKVSIIDYDLDSEIADSDFQAPVF